MSLNSYLFKNIFLFIYMTYSLAQRFPNFFRSHIPNNKNN